MVYCFSGGGVDDDDDAVDWGDELKNGITSSEGV